MLNEIPLFEGLPEPQLAELLSLTHEFTYPRGSIITSQGELSNSLHIILEGRLKVFVNGSEGKQVVLSFLTTGDFVGELSLLDNEPRSASVLAVAKTRTLMLTQEAFNRFVDNHPETLLPMLRVLAKRLRALDETICSLSTLDVYGRVARVLLQQAQDQEVGQITPRMTHQDIAEMVGCSREMVSRILKDLRTGGYISIDGQKRIVINRKLPSRW